MHIILTRHGETEENKLGVLQGWKIGTLSELGRDQARILGEKLKDTKISVIYTSDLDRCVKTVQEISKYHPKTKIIKDKRLRERSPGIFEGKIVGKNDWEALEGDIFTNRPEGGENFLEVWERVKKFYEDILKKYSDETILVVGHGGSMCLLQGLIQGKDLKYSLIEIKGLKNTATIEFEINSNGKYRLVS